MFFFFLLECPENCERCYVKSISDSNAVCYPSECKIGYGFDDNSGLCFSCGFGCDYCYKSSNDIFCKKCSGNYVPKFNEKRKIIKCLFCNIENCENCEFRNDNIKCASSGYLKKKENNKSTISPPIFNCTNEYFFENGTSQQNLNDRNVICPNGSIYILSGSDAGSCKRCPENCRVCELTTNGENVRCKTCMGQRQYLQVEKDSEIVMGCFGKHLIFFT